MIDNAIIKFSDGSTLTINEQDHIRPIIFEATENDPIPAYKDPVLLYSHVHYGLTYALLEVLYRCDYFYVNEDFSTVYCSKSIVSITTNL